jgi:uncharacterized protein YecT (DUF1311 family)
MRKISQTAGALVFISSFGLLTLSHFANSASFYCDDRIDNNIDKAICTNYELSALDERLYDVYKTSVEYPDGSYDVDALRSEQRHWVRSSRNKCRKAKSIAACLTPIYKSRINALLITGPVPSDRKIRITRASDRYDYQLEFVDIKESDDGPEHFGRVAVYEKDGTAPLQRIPMSQLYVALDDENKPLINAAQMYDEQGTINVGDFNFDGDEDVAIRNGNNGSYGGPSYDVFLYSKKEQRLIKNTPLTELIESTLGMFDFDPSRKRLSTWAKSGCCWHQHTEYEVQSNTPVAVYRMTEVPEDLGNGDYLFVQTHEVLENGVWRTTKIERMAPE